MKKITVLTAVILLVSIAQAQTPRRRSQVKDAHDKYANEEIKYLQEKAQPSSKTANLSRLKKAEDSVKVGRIIKKKSPGKE